MKDRQFYVFSSNAGPFEPDQAYSPFAVYALLEHNGDFEAAARGLGLEGYGETAPIAPDVDLSGIVGPIASNNLLGESDNGETAIAEEPDPGVFPSHLLEVPGLIGEIAQFISDTNYTHQPVVGDMVKFRSGDEERWFGNFPRVMTEDWCGEFTPCSQEDCDGQNGSREAEVAKPV